MSTHKSSSSTYTHSHTYIFIYVYPLCVHKGSLLRRTHDIIIIIVMPSSSLLIKRALCALCAIRAAVTFKLHSAILPSLRTSAPVPIVRRFAAVENFHLSAAITHDGPFCTLSASFYRHQTLWSFDQRPAYNVLLAHSSSCSSSSAEAITTIPSRRSIRVYHHPLP